MFSSTHTSDISSLFRPGTFALLALLWLPTSVSFGAKILEEESIRRQLVEDLVKQVPGILASQDKTTGRFGVEPWNSRDQFAIHALAAAWAVEHPANPYYRSPEVLAAVMDGGDVLVREQDTEGRWPYIKKDGSFWGHDRSCWTYSRWVRAYLAVKPGMPEARRARWEEGLTRGFERIATQDMRRIHNIPTFHAASLYAAGLALDRPDWRTSATEFLRGVAKTQNPDGYWVEDAGPVVNYGVVYFDALGIYHCLSGDREVLPALERAGRFHSAFTYPDGTMVETIDQRNSYHDQMTSLTVGYTFGPEGRAFLREQLARLKAGGEPLNSDMIAPLLLYADRSGTVTGDERGGIPVLLTLGAADDPDAVVVRRKGWVACLSGFTAPISTSRWIQDRQNLVSLYSRELGLIVGGGSTKLQPLWSTFTVGDPALLAHRPGDTSPEFRPPAGVLHVPDRVELDPDKLELTGEYGPVKCGMTVEILDEGQVRLRYRADAADEITSPVEAHLTLMPAMGERWESGGGERGTLDRQPVMLSASELGESFTHRGCRVTIPAGSTLHWPVLPHNPYKKDGSAAAKDGRIVVTIPLKPGEEARTVEVESATRKSAGLD